MPNLRSRSAQTPKVFQISLRLQDFLVMELAGLDLSAEQVIS